jgi:hypothetical protein
MYSVFSRSLQYLNNRIYLESQSESFGIFYWFIVVSKRLFDLFKKAVALLFKITRRDDWVKKITSI